MKNILFILLFLSFCTQAQTITTFAGNGTGNTGGDGGPAIAASFLNPSGLAIDHMGNIYAGDVNGFCVRKINTVGIITTVVGDYSPCPENYYPQNVMATATCASSIVAVGVDMAGNIYTSDDGTEVLKTDVHGMIGTFAGNGGYGSSGDGGPATAAQIYGTYAVLPDDNGNVYIATNGAVKKVNPAGIITTIFHTSAFPSGLAMDPAGNLYVSDRDLSVVTKITPSGSISAVAGNHHSGYTGDGAPATAAALESPMGLAVDRIGNLYIADMQANVVRKVDTSGIISTVAGNGYSIPFNDSIWGWGGYSGDGGPATAAELDAPWGLTIDRFNNLYISDYYNHVIRRVSNIIPGNNTVSILPHSPIDNADNEISTAMNPVFSATGVASVAEANNTISLYPVPAINQLTISSSQTINYVCITNEIGKTLYTYHGNSTSVQIDVAALTPGIYFVKINNISVRRFLKQ